MISQTGYLNVYENLFPKGFQQSLWFYENKRRFLSIFFVKVSAEKSEVFLRYFYYMTFYDLYLSKVFIRNYFKLHFQQPSTD